MTLARPRLVTAAVIAAVAAAIAAGLLVIGPPSEERMWRLDERRVEQLRRIAGEMEDYYRRRDALPATLAALAAAAADEIALRDPDTGDGYAYRALDPHRYELCATFDRATPGEAASFWSHPAGRRCFALDARTAAR